MASDNSYIDQKDFESRFYGTDTPPLMAKVPEPPPAGWGKVTSTARTLSPQYLKFLGKKHKEVRDD